MYKEIFVWYYLDEHQGPTDDYEFSDNGAVKLATIESVYKGVRYFMIPMKTVTYIQ